MRRGVVVDPGDDHAAMMAYGGAMGPSTGSGSGNGGGGSGEVLGTATGDYSPQSTPAPLTGTVENTYTPGPASYSPQDSPASSAGGSGNGQLPSFGFTQEQVACVCEVSPTSPLPPSSASICRGNPHDKSKRPKDSIEGETTLAVAPRKCLFDL